MTIEQEQAGRGRHRPPTDPFADSAVTERIIIPPTRQTPTPPPVRLTRRVPAPPLPPQPQTQQARNASEPPRKRRRRWPWILLAAFALLIIMIVSANSGGNPAAPSTTATPGAAPSATAPGQDNASAVPAPAPAAPPKVYTGKGDNVLKIDKAAGPAIMSFTCAKCSGNTIVQSDGADPLLVNTIGSYSGKKAIDVTDGSTTSQLTIKATGAWKVTVGGLDQATQATGTAPITGKGDDVIVLSGNTTTAAITNHGDQNFIVQAIPADGGVPDLAVNEIGSYTGTVPIAAPALVQVTSDGSWTITPQP